MNSCLYWQGFDYLDLIFKKIIYQFTSQLSYSWHSSHYGVCLEKYHQACWHFGRWIICVRWTQKRYLFQALQSLFWIKVDWWFKCSLQQGIHWLCISSQFFKKSLRWCFTSYILRSECSAFAPGKSACFPVNATRCKRFAEWWW